MPFVRKSDAGGQLNQPTDVSKIFVGRSNELHFFAEHILRPENPAYNIISIYGDGGVGKSTLLTRLIEETRAPNYKDYCLTALVDERQATIASMLEKFTEQLHTQGTFRKALAHYKEALHRQHEEQDTMQDEVLQRAPDFAGAAVEGIPFVGPLLRESLKVTTSHMVQGLRNQQVSRELRRLDDPLADLTRAFNNELDHLADATVVSNRVRLRHRILLFFDTFEQLASEVTPWLLDDFLALDINSNIVLIVAGRLPLERSGPEDPKRWLPFRESIYPVSLQSFTQDETRAYLEQRGVIDTALIDRFWQLSHGLPLYLGLLTSHTQHDVDTTADVVANFLRWIPAGEEIKRRLVLDAALFSRPFNQDDLAAFAYIPPQEREGLYHWLARQSFVRRMAQEGRYSYHELAADLFSRYLFHNSPNACSVTRQALVAYYREELEHLLQQGNEQVDSTPAWLSLMLALAQQLFLLPTASNHLEAIEQTLQAYESTKQEEEITRVLRDITEVQFYNQANADAQRSAALVLQYIVWQENPTSEQFLAAANALLAKVASAPNFSPTLLASIYDDRGVAYSKLNNHSGAIESFNRALALNPQSARAYGNRGATYRSLREFEKALQDFTVALALDATLDWCYVGRGEVYRHLSQYEQAMADFNRAIELDPLYPEAYVGRGRVNRYLARYEQSIADIQYALTLEAEDGWIYNQLGETYRRQHKYAEAIEQYTHTIELDPAYYWSYGARGLAYSMSRAYSQALADFDSAIGLNANYTFGYGQRGKIYYQLKNYERALADMQRAIELNPQNDWAYRQLDLIYRALGRHQ